MKDTLIKAFYFSSVGIVTIVFLTTGLTSLLSVFIVQKMSISSDEITISVAEIILLVAQLSYVLSTVLLLINFKKMAYVVGILAIVFSSLNIVAGSLIAKNLNNDFIAIISALLIAFLLYGFVVYYNLKKKNTE